MINDHIHIVHIYIWNYILYIFVLYVWSPWSNFWDSHCPPTGTCRQPPSCRVLLIVRYIFWFMVRAQWSHLSMQMSGHQLQIGSDRYWWLSRGQLVHDDNDVWWSKFQFQTIQTSMLHQWVRWYTWTIYDFGLASLASNVPRCSTFDLATHHRSFPWSGWLVRCPVTFALCKVPKRFCFANVALWRNNHMFLE